MNSLNMLAKDVLTMAEREIKNNDYAHTPAEYALIVRALAKDNQDIRAELDQARAALKQIKDLANYDIDHEEDGNTYQIEAIASAALGER